MNTGHQQLSCRDAIDLYTDFIGIPFCEFLSDNELDSLANTSNKGMFGQFAELTLGKSLDNARLDFIDGELKTFTSDNKGLVPSGGSICLTNIGTAHVDELLVEHRPKQAGEIRSALYGGAVVYEKEKALYLKRHFVTDVAMALVA